MSIEKICKANKALASKIVANGYFFQSADLPALIEIDRLMPVLVRCGNGRFTCAAQDVTHFIAIIEEHSNDSPGSVENDYVRDISLPVGHFSTIKP